MDQIRDRWSRSGSASMDLLLERGSEALDAGDAESALGFFTALVDHAPDFAAGYALRSKTYYMMGLTGPALSDIESALALEPRQFDALAGLAMILEESGSTEEALAAWQALAELTPHLEEVREALVRLAAGPGGTVL